MCMCVCVSCMVSVCVSREGGEWNVGMEEVGRGGVRGGRWNEEAQLEWATSSGQSTSHSVATPSGLWSCPISQRADRKDPAAWGCCRRLSGMCDRPIVAAPMASPASVTIDGGARLSLWTTGHEGACRGRVEGT